MNARPAFPFHCASNPKIMIVPNAKGSKNASDHSIVASSLEIGTAWRNLSRTEWPYLSMNLDAPSFPATIYSRLVEGKDGAHNLTGVAQRVQLIVAIDALPSRRGGFAAHTSYFNSSGRQSANSG